jgi:hypothetical protein
MVAQSTSTSTPMRSGIPAPPRDPRPDFGRALETLTRALTKELDVLSSLDAKGILFVPLAAHGTVAASVRGLDDVAKSVTIDGRRRRHEIGLRPRFFLGATPSQRLTTLIHELLHIDSRGGLLDEKRHVHRAHHVHEEEAAAAARDALEALSPELFFALGHTGEVLMRAWRARPVIETRARVFTTRDVYWQPVVMETPRTSRTTWA